MGLKGIICRAVVQKGTKASKTDSLIFIASSPSPLVTSLQPYAPSLQAKATTPAISLRLGYEGLDLTNILVNEHFFRYAQYLCLSVGSPVGQSIRWSISQFIRQSVISSLKLMKINAI